MWMFTRLSATALAAALLLSGCVQADPVVTADPKPSATPLFASEADALAAATAAYAAYVKVSDEIFMDGGSHPERLKNVAIGEQLRADLNGFAKASSAGVHSTGGTTFESIRLQDYDSSATKGRAVVAVYLCEDVSKVDVMDAQGSSVVSDTRPNRVKYEVQFDDARGESSPLRVSHKEPWGDGKC